VQYNRHSIPKRSHRPFNFFPTFYGPVTKRLCCKVQSDRCGSLLFYQLRGSPPPFSPSPSLADDRTPTVVFPLATKAAQVPVPTKLSFLSLFGLYFCRCCSCDLEKIFLLWAAPDDGLFFFGIQMAPSYPCLPWGSFQGVVVFCAPCLIAFPVP